jgi:type IV secretion system protein TrbL
LRALLHACICLLLAWQLADGLVSCALAAGVPAAVVEDPADRRYQVPIVSGNREDFGRALRAPVDGLVEAAATIHRRLQPWGVELLALLTGVALAWMGLKTALERPPLGLLLGEFLSLSLTAGILFAVLDRWDAVTGAIIAGAAEVSRQVSGNVHGGPAAVHGVQRMLDAAFWLWEHADAGIGSVLDPLMLLGTLLFKLAIALLLLLCGCIYLGIYLMSMILLSIAFALGPVFLPWLMLRPASFLFDGWVRFTLVAALYQVIGIVVVTLVSRMHEPMMAGVGTAIDPASGAFNFYYFAATFLLSGVSAMLMLQVPSIANGLVGGSIATRFAPGAAISAASLRALRGRPRG